MFIILQRVRFLFPSLAISLQTSHVQFSPQMGKNRPYSRLKMKIHHKTLPRAPLLKSPSLGWMLSRQKNIKVEIVNSAALSSSLACKWMFFSLRHPSSLTLWAICIGLHRCLCTLCKRTWCSGNGQFNMKSTPWLRFFIYFLNSNFC